jgi:hypothetical protein
MSGTDQLLTISFECPVCEEQIELEGQANNSLFRGSNAHSKPWNPEEGCSIAFSREERTIRRNYDFIQSTIPLLFVELCKQVTDQDILRSAIDAVDESGLGVSIEVTEEDDASHNYTLSVFGWYDTKTDMYYAVTHNIQTRKNVVVTESKQEFGEFIERWYYHNREYAQDDQDHYYRSDQNRQLDSFS